MSQVGRAHLAVLVAFALGGAFCGTPAAATPSGWQATTYFVVFPQQVPGSAEGAARIGYRLLDPQGQPIGEPTMRPLIHPVELVDVPSVPGIYTFEGWLEDAAGNELRRGSTSLRFDDTVPPTPSPRPPAGWLLGTEPVVLRLDPPSGPQPISGMRTEATFGPGEIRGTSDGDSIALGFLPEGIDQVEVTAVSGAGVRSQSVPVTLAVDATAPTVSLQGLPSGWSSGPLRLTATAHDPLSGMEAAGAAGPFTAISVDGGAPTTAPGGTVTTWVTGSGVHSVRFYGRDAAGNVGDGGPGSPPPRTALVPIDGDPPRVEFAAAQDPADPERIEALVVDRLSGPSPARGSIEVRRAGTRAGFAPLATRVRDGRLVARWDSDSYPGGKYEFLATGFDAAGNSATGSDRAHGGRMVLVNPLKTPVTLRAKLADLRLSGSLRRGTGGPVAGQSVTIAESFAAGSDRSQRTTEVRTGPDGTFVLRLGPGPSREVTASFAGSRMLSRASAPTVRFSAATRIRFHASAATATIGGRPVVFGGRVFAPGARRALAGLPVELQFRYRGAGWSEFRTVETDDRGRFRFSYRFSDDDSRGVRFGFRAYVKGREGWPFGPGASRPLSVRGR
jgi:hypothetical protein